LVKSLHEFLTPFRLTVLSFLLAILIGTCLLKLPFATVTPISWVDCLFTSTSAVCVTGLIVVDTATKFTRFGQIVILTLIQFGGLGIMTLSTVFLVFLRGRASLTNIKVMKDTFTSGSAVDIYGLLKLIIFFTLTVEAAGAGLLFLRFRKLYPTTTALFHSVFQAISAFCNAGFSTFSDSLMGFRGDVLVNLVMGGLIIVGGIGFLVVWEVRRSVRRIIRREKRTRVLSLHTKLVLIVTATLLIFGTIIYAALEWDILLTGLPWYEKVLAAFFQSVTTRTAGFNSIDIRHLANASILITIFLMFVGASPGSTGGGIKTSTFGVLVALGISRLRSEEEVNLFRRTLSKFSVWRALSVTLTAIFVIATATMLLMLTEGGISPFLDTPGMFVEILFEVVSAFGTVGLSLGITAGLTAIGKIIIVLVMYTGRLGPMLIALAISPREKRARFKYAEEQVMIG